MSKPNFLRVTALTVVFCSAFGLRADANDLATAKAKIAAKDFNGALEVLAPLAKEENAGADVWAALGDANTGARWFEDAQACYQKSLELEPENGDVLLNLGFVSLIAGMPEKSAAQYFDKAAAIDFARNDYAQHWKYSLMKYTSIPGRSVTTEYVTWLKGEKAKDKERWPVVLGRYLRDPMSNQKLVGAMEKERARRSEAGEADDRIDIEAYLYIGRKCHQSGLIGIAIDHYKQALKEYTPGKIEWELARAYFGRMGKELNWLPSAGFRYEPNEAGELEVRILDADSFALECGLKNRDVILSIAGLEADFEIMGAVMSELRVGDVIDLKVRRDKAEHSVMLVMDADGYRPRAADRVRPR